MDDFLNFYIKTNNSYNLCPKNAYKTNLNNDRNTISYIYNILWPIWWSSSNTAFLFEEDHQIGRNTSKFHLLLIKKNFSWCFLFHILNKEQFKVSNQLIQAVIY